jgi:ribosomal protein L37AE/L43A
MCLLKKVCPNCNSIYIYRKRRIKIYHCTSCLTEFIQPATRENEKFSYGSIQRAGKPINFVVGENSPLRNSQFNW